MWSKLTARFVVLACSLAAGPIAAGQETATLWDSGTPHLIREETRYLDFTQSEAYAQLGEGWHDALGRTHSLGADNALGALSIVSDLSVRVHRPRDLSLHLRIMPRPAPDLGDQRITVAWNDHPIGTLAFDAKQGWTTMDFELAVPAAAVTYGVNTIQFLSRYAVSAKEINAGNDPRVYAFGLHHLAIAEPGAVVSRDSEATRWEDERIVQAPDSELVFPQYPKGDGPVQVVVDAIEGPGQIEVRWDHFGAVHREVFEADASADVRITPPSDRPFAVVLRAASEPVRWARPRIAGVAPAAPATPAPEATPPQVDNVILVIFDALRGDRVGYAPYPRPTTPFLDTLAARGRVFPKAYSTAPYTYSSTWSLLTGLFPFQHRATELPRKPPASVPRLQHWLTAQGVRTACVAANPYLTPGTGIPDGFDHFSSGLENLPSADKARMSQGFQKALQGDPTLVTEAATEFIQTNADVRFFLYAHYRQPHAPYYATVPWYHAFATAPGEVFPAHGTALRQVTLSKRPLPREALQHLNARYDENLRVADAELEKLWGIVKEKGLTGRTALVFTSDHGESFMEHGILSHSQTVYNAETHIPLMILLPEDTEDRPRTVHRVASTVDIFPTISALLGIAPPADLPGRNLLAPLPEIDTGTVRAIAQSEPESMPWEGYYFDRYKLIRHRHRFGVELYDLENDPEERRNLAPVYPVLTNYLLTRATAWKAANAREAEAGEQSDALDENIVEQLEALGYVN